MVTKTTDEVTVQEAREASGDLKTYKVYLNRDVYVTATDEFDAVCKAEAGQSDAVEEYVGDCEVEEVDE